nr:MAG TPA: hypothetical protein [Caudoviricetes sp.]
MYFNKVYKVTISIIIDTKIFLFWIIPLCYSSLYKLTC